MLEQSAKYVSFCRSTFPSCVCGGVSDTHLVPLEELFDYNREMYQFDQARHAMPEQPVVVDVLSMFTDV